MQQAHQLYEHGYSYEEILQQTQDAIKREVDRKPRFNLEDLKNEHLLLAY